MRNSTIIALRMVVRRPVRSLLAALGVALTIGALVVAVSIARRGQAQALAEIRQMGATVLTVNAQASRNRGDRARTGAEVSTLTLHDARAIEQSVPGVRAVAAEYRATVPVIVGDLARQATVSSIEPAYATLREAPMRAGRFFTQREDAAAERDAVLGAQMARDLFGVRDPVGELIRVRGIPFVVIGVLPARGTGLDAFDEDEVIFIPLTTARRRLFQVDHVQRLFVRVDAESDLTIVGDAVRTLLGVRHRAGTDGPADFRVQDQRRLVTLRESAVLRLGSFQVAVTGILLTAGAGGVFALQYLSVRERRPEIGTRRALGASRGAIFGQFMIEATMITMSGACLGAVAGTVGTMMAGTHASLSLVASACVACAVAGTLAAIDPARRAAMLPPAVACRAA